LFEWHIVFCVQILMEICQFFLQQISK
jgi:hypothetical protein